MSALKMDASRSTYGGVVILREVVTSQGGSCHDAARYVHAENQGDNNPLRVVCIDFRELPEE